MADAGAGRVGSVIGRYFAMDRDKRWDRLQLAYDLLVHGRAEHHAATGAEAAARRLRARRDRRVHQARARRRGGADPPRRLRRSASTSGPTGCARSPARSPSPASPRSTAAAPAPSARYAVHDRVRGGLAVPGRVPARAPVGDDVDGDRGARRPPAPRRRDREVPARDVLLQRRRGDAVRGRAARARPLAARRADLRLQAGDERARGRRRVRRRLAEADSPRSGSSTSPTPTWSATPA